MLGAAATSSHNDLQSSCNTQCVGWNGYVPPLFSLCEREQLLTSLRVIRDAGEGVIRCQEVRTARGQAGLEDRKVRRYEGRLFTVKSLSSFPPTLLSSDNPLPQSLPQGREAEKSTSRFTPHPSLKKHAAFTLAEGATHVTTSDKIRRAAFTLAEVLITLGIIGVVAAMTMPSLINSTQKQELVAQYKKVYSVLSQAYLMISNDNGGSLEGVFTSNNDYIDVFSKYIKDVKTCRTNEEVTRCYLDSFKYLSGHVVNTDPGSTLTTPDGAILLFLHDSNTCTGTRELNKPIDCGRIRVDVNGTKKPNTVGYDIFDFYITQNGIIPRGHKDTTVEEDDPSGYGRGITILTKGKIDY